MTDQALIIASLTEPPSEESLEHLSKQADILEVRADLVRKVDPAWLRDHFAGQLLYTLRSRAEGGRSEASAERRVTRLQDASGLFDLVDLEAERDLSSEVLDAIPAAKRMISWHGPPSSLVRLQKIFGRMSEVPARFYKLVPAAEQPRQEMAPLALLHSLRRQDIIAFASGPIGTWTRLIALRLGAPVVFGSAGALPAAPGQLSVQRLVEDFCLPELHPVEALFGLVGSNIDQSLSPRLHNVLYRELGLPCLYLPFHVEAFGDFWLEVVESGAFAELGFRLLGLSVTAPYKRIASAVAGASSPLVEWLGSANTLICRGGVWEAESTDGEGTLKPLLELGVTIDGAAAAVVGAGGAGRAATVALRQAGADVVLVNRSVEQGRKAAHELRVPFRSLEGFDPAEFDILVHATSLGQAEGDPMAIAPEAMRHDSTLLEMVYLPDRPTPLVDAARLAGRQAVDGREVLLHQAVPQFQLMTDHELPIESGRQLLGLGEPLG